MTETQAGTLAHRNIAPRSDSARPTTGIRRGRLLVVHRYASLRQAIAQTLRYHRYEVLEAGSVGDGVALLAAGDPALLMVELGGEAEGGEAPAAELSRAAREAGAAIVGLASHPIEEEDAAALGMQEILVMPVEQCRLVAAVDRLLEAARGEVAGGDGDEDPQCRLELEDRLRAEHLSLSFVYPDVTRIPLTPANDGRVRTFAGRLATLAIDPEVRIDGTDLLFRYEVSIADALMLEESGEVERLHERLRAAFPPLRARPAALRERLSVLAAELRRLQRIAS